MKRKIPCLPGKKATMTSLQSTSSGDVISLTFEAAPTPTWVLVDGEITNGSFQGFKPVSEAVKLFEDICDWPMGDLANLPDDATAEDFMQAIPKWGPSKPHIQWDYESSNEPNHAPFNEGHQSEVDMIKEHLKLDAYFKLVEQLEGDVPEDVEQWHTTDSHIFTLRPQITNWMITRSPLIKVVHDSIWHWEESWEYPTREQALMALQTCPSVSDPEDGWVRHRPSGRRRPDGDPLQEFIRDDGSGDETPSGRNPAVPVVPADDLNTVRTTCDLCEGPGVPRPSCPKCEGRGFIEIGKVADCSGFVTHVMEPMPVWIIDGQRWSVSPMEVVNAAFGPRVEAKFTLHSGGRKVDVRMPYEEAFSLKLTDDEGVVVDLDFFQHATLTEQQDDDEETLWSNPRECFRVLDQTNFVIARDYRTGQGYVRDRRLKDQQLKRPDSLPFWKIVTQNSFVRDMSGCSGMKCRVLFVHGWGVTWSRDDVQALEAMIKQRGLTTVEVYY